MHAHPIAGIHDTKHIRSVNKERTHAHAHVTHPRETKSMQAYQAAMEKERARLAAATARNASAAVASSAGADDDELDAKEAAWAHVFAAGQKRQAESEEEARKRKQQRKAEKRKEKANAETANAANLAIYVSGLPTDVNWTAVHALFARCGHDVKRVKLYKDARTGENKGDGLVTFASEDGVAEALRREWNLHGQAITVEAAHFEAKPAASKNDEQPQETAADLHASATSAPPAPPVSALPQRAPEAPPVAPPTTKPVPSLITDAEYAAFQADVAASPAPSVLTLPVGGFVKLLGLKSAADRNGQVGEIREYMHETGRYRVALRDETLLALRSANLLQMLAVELCDLEGDLATHNGKKATLFDYDATAPAYGAQLEGDDAIAIPLSGAIFPDGSIGTVVGLQGAPQYNGQLCRILSHDASAGRYTVECEVGKQLRLKRQNVLAVGMS